MEKEASREMGRTMVGTIETLEHFHLAHSLSLFPLTFFFGIHFA